MPCAAVAGKSRDILENFDQCPAIATHFCTCAEAVNRFSTMFERAPWVNGRSPIIVNLKWPHLPSGRCSRPRRFIGWMRLQRRFAKARSLVFWARCGLVQAAGKPGLGSSMSGELGWLRIGLPALAGAFLGRRACLHVGCNGPLLVDRTLQRTCASIRRPP